MIDRDSPPGAYERHIAMVAPAPPANPIPTILANYGDDQHVTLRAGQIRAAIANAAAAGTDCKVPPKGRRCTRKAGHDGLCAAIRADKIIPADVHPSHDVRDDGWYISDPVCTRCRVGAEDTNRALLRDPCTGAPPPSPPSDNDRWWAERYLKNATPGERHAMRELLA